MAQPKPFDSDDKPATYSQIKRQKEHQKARKMPWFYVVVGVIVAVAAAMFIYDRAETYYSRKRLESIRAERDELFYKIVRGTPPAPLPTERMLLLPGDPTMPDEPVKANSVEPVKANPDEDVRSDSDRKRLTDRDAELEQEEREILRRHPQF